MQDLPLEIRPADLDDSRVVELLNTHTERALAGARCRDGHALDVEALRHPDIEVWAIWRGGAPVAVGALRPIHRSHGELKSMFVADAARRCGLGQRMLDGLIERARSKGMSRLSLETGASAYFEAARRLYERNGFRVCETFADLPPHADSVFLSRPI